MAVALADQVSATVVLPGVAARFSGTVGTEMEDEEEADEVEALETDEFEEAEDVDEELTDEATEDEADDDVDGEVGADEEELDELSPAPPPQPASTTKPMNISPRNAAKLGLCLIIMNVLGNATE